jgi:hypothetical protein
MKFIFFTVNRPYFTLLVGRFFRLNVTPREKIITIYLEVQVFWARSFVSFHCKKIHCTKKIDTVETGNGKRTARPLRALGLLVSSDFLIINVSCDAFDVLEMFSRVTWRPATRDPTAVHVRIPGTLSTCPPRSHTTHPLCTSPAQTTKEERKKEGYGNDGDNLGADLRGSTGNVE